MSFYTLQDAWPAAQPTMLAPVPEKRFFEEKSFRFLKSFFRFSYRDIQKLLKNIKSLTFCQIVRNLPSHPFL